MPKLTRNLKPEEFKEYYFLKEELKDFCRSEGLKVGGSKEDLEKRVVHYLATGEELKERKVRQSSKETVTEISLDSKLGENFKCSEDKRAFFEKEIGSSFKFKVKFQKWLKSNPEKTYRDAVEAYYEIQNSGEKTKIDKELGISSLGMVQIICALEDEFDIEIPNSAIKKLKNQTVAILSYIDPASAIILSSNPCLN